MTDYQKYINSLRKCAKEHDNDITSFGHIIVSYLCRDTANLLEKLEQENVLDKIRAEIEKPLHDERCFDTADAKAQYIALNWCIEIIDKYREGEL